MHAFHYSSPDRAFLLDSLRFFNWRKTLFLVAFQERKGMEAETNVSGPIYISQKKEIQTRLLPSLPQRYSWAIHLTPDTFLILHVCLAGGNLQRECGTAWWAVVVGMKGRHRLYLLRRWLMGYVGREREEVKIVPRLWVLTKACETKRKDEAITQNISYIHLLVMGLLSLCSFICWRKETSRLTQHHWKIE